MSKTFEKINTDLDDLKDKQDTLQADINAVADRLHTLETTSSDASVLTEKLDNIE